MSHLILSIMILISQGSGQAGELNLQQQAHAARLAATVPWQQARGRLTEHPLGLQTLSIEEQDTKHSGIERIARVYQYDYNQRASRMLVLDLVSDAVLRNQTIASVHLPLNAQEIRHALDLLSSDSPIIAKLRAEQARRGQPPFETLDDIHVKASIFEPLNQAHACAWQRCALLSLFDDSHTVFAVEPIVKLDDGRVGLLSGQ